MNSNRRSLKLNLELLSFLTLKELKEKYKFAYLGLVWFLIIPFVTLGTLYVIFTYFFPFQIEGYPYYLLTGLVPWFFISFSIGGGIHSITGNANLIRKVAFPKTLLPLSVITYHFMIYLISIGIMLSILFFKNQAICWAMIPLNAAIILFFTYNITSSLAYLVVVYKDIRPITELSLFLLFYATPIFYTLAQVNEKYIWLFQANPIYLIVESHRLVMQGYQSPVSLFIPLLSWLAATTLIRYFIHRSLDQNIADFVS